MAFNVSFIIRLQDKFSKSSKKVAASAERMKTRVLAAGGATGKLSDKLKENKKKLDSVRAGFIALAAALAIVVFPIREAIRFEEAMAEVRKVVDFPEPDGLKKMGRTVRNLSRDIPLLPREIAKIVAAGGQLGIPTENLAEFAELISKVAVALDVVPEVAGTAFARLQTVFKITQSETVALADAINELSNNAAVSGDELIRALANKSAAAGKAMGLTANETVALAGTFISLGVRADRTGSIIDSMARRIGDSATLSKALGDETGKLGKKIQLAIQERGAPALLEFLEKFQKIPAAERTEVLTEVFGEFGIRLGAVVGNLDVLRKQLNITTNATRFAGSVNKEFANRMDTTGAKLKLLRNRFLDLSITIGATQLPLVNFIAAGLGGLIFGLSTLAENFPVVTTLIVGFGAALVALGIGGLIFKGVGAGIALTLAKFGPKFAAAALAILKLSPKLATRIAVLGPAIATGIVKGLVKKLFLLALAPDIAKVAFKIGNFLGEKILGPLLAKISEVFPKFGKFIKGLGNIIRQDLLAPLKAVKALFDEGFIKGVKQLIFGVKTPDFGTEKLRRLQSVRQKAIVAAEEQAPAGLQGAGREQFIQAFVAAEVKREARIDINVNDPNNTLKSVIVSGDAVQEVGMNNAVTSQ